MTLARDSRSPRSSSIAIKAAGLKPPEVEREREGGFKYSLVKTQEKEPSRTFSSPFQGQSASARRGNMVADKEPHSA